MDYFFKNIYIFSKPAFPPPEEKANGVAVVICPGGRHRELVFNAECVETARFLNGPGVASFAIKYRPGHEEGSPYEPRSTPGRTGSAP